MGRVTNANPFLAITTWPSLHLTFKVSQYIAGLTLASFGDEILPVRSQKLADQCLFGENKIAKFCREAWAHVFQRT